MARRIKILSVRCKVQLFSHFKKFQFRLWNFCLRHWWLHKLKQFFFFTNKDIRVG